MLLLLLQKAPFRQISRYKRLTTTALLLFLFLRIFSEADFAFPKITPTTDLRGMYFLMLIFEPACIDTVNAEIGLIIRLFIGRLF